MSENFIQLLEEFEKEKGISCNVLIGAIEEALESAYKKNYGSHHDVRVTINRNNGEMSVMIKKTVVEEVFDPDTEISLEDAKNIKADYEIGDIVEKESTVRRFARIAAQKARQVVTQRIREAERNMVYTHFSGKIGDIISGIIQRVERKNVLVNFGEMGVAVLSPQEQVPTDNYVPNQRIKVYVVDVQKTTKAPIITISRTHANLVKKLFEMEVAEISGGIVEIKSVAREAGSRTKIAVSSTDENVDPIGACVGPKCMRVNNVVQELNGEKIEIIKYSEDPSEYIKAALAPAKVVSVTPDIETKICSVVVEPNQLSLAIGKEGQNARLAAKLTGWKIDITKADEAIDETQEAID